MADFITTLEADLVDAARRSAGARAARPPLRPLLLAAALFLGIAATAGAATLFVVRDNRIPAPSRSDAGPGQIPVPGSARLAPLRAADPAGGLPWALRISRTRDGQTCATAGELRGTTLGITGLDGRFRTIDEGVADGCGRVQPPRSVLIGARVFDAKQRTDVRTVVHGVGGPTLRRVVLVSGGVPKTLPVAAGGVFVTALRGYPEDLAVDVKLTFADGERKTYPLGTSSFVVPDPLGGPAWQIESFGIGIDPQRCVNFTWARTRRGAPSSPPACGLGPDRPRWRGYYFAVRRVGPDGGRNALLGRWPARVPPRTAVWGTVGEDIEQVVVTGAGAPREPRISLGRTFLVVYPPSVDPARLRVRLTRTDGKVIVRAGDTNLVKPPKMGP